MNRRLRGRLALLALGLTGVLISFSVLRPRPEAPAPASPPPVPTPAATPLTLRRIVAAPLTSARSAVSEVSLECAAFERALLDLAVEDFEYPPRVARVPNPRGCAPRDPSTARILAHYAGKCAGPIENLPGAELPREKWDESVAECQLALLLARSTLAAAARAPRAIAEIDDLRELADLLIASFGRLYVAGFGESPAEMRKIADRMVALDPSLVPAHKAGAMAAMLEAIQAKEGGAAADSVDWTGLEDRVREIRERVPADADVDTLDRIAKTEGMDPERVKQDALSRLSARPDDWRENQILAWANWKLGRRDEARSVLQRALELNPEEPELKENWRATGKPGAGPDDFKVVMRLGVDFRALLE